jgi:hypothetical protein
VTGGQRKVPWRRRGHTTAVTIGSERFYLTANQRDDGSLGEVFIHWGKHGTSGAGLVNTYAIALSVGLRHLVPLPELIRPGLGQYFAPNGLTDDPEIPAAHSPVDYVARRLAIDWLPYSERAVLGVYTRAERVRRWELAAGIGVMPRGGGTGGGGPAAGDWPGDRRAWPSRSIQYEHGRSPVRHGRRVLRHGLQRGGRPGFRGAARSARAARRPARPRRRLRARSPHAGTGQARRGRDGRRHLVGADRQGPGGRASGPARHSLRPRRRGLPGRAAPGRVRRGDLSLRLVRDRRPGRGRRRRQRRAAACRVVRVLDPASVLPRRDRRRRLLAGGVPVLRRGLVDR